MAPPTPCTRHSPHVWMAFCPDCTTWHLARAIALRDSTRPSGVATMPADPISAPRRRDGHAVLAVA